MIQNKKIWFFVEGECERLFIFWLMCNSYPEVNAYRSESEFIKSNIEASYFITDCRSGDKIPFEINENYYKIASVQCNVIIVCDLEESPCVIERKLHVLDKLDDEVDKNLIKFIFSRPMIEDIYCSEKEATKKILESHVKANELSVNIPVNLASLEKKKTSPYDAMKKLYKEHKLSFKKTAFAEKFFSQFEYRKSLNGTVQRLVKFVDTMFNGVS